MRWSAPDGWPADWRELWLDCAVRIYDAADYADRNVGERGTVVADDLGSGAVLVVWDDDGRDGHDGDRDGTPTIYGWVLPVFALESAP